MQYPGNFQNMKPKSFKKMPISGHPVNELLDSTTMQFDAAIINFDFNVKSTLNDDASY